MNRLPDHPEIQWAERTGYPSWQQEDDDVIYCCECGEPMDKDSDNIYSCSTHRVLCLECLKMLHKIYRWE